MRETAARRAALCRRPPPAACCRLLPAAASSAHAGRSLRQTPTSFGTATQHDLNSSPIGHAVNAGGACTLDLHIDLPGMHGQAPLARSARPPPHGARQVQQCQLLMLSNQPMPLLRSAEECSCSCHQQGQGRGSERHVAGAGGGRGRPRRCRCRGQGAAKGAGGVALKGDRVGRLPRGVQHAIVLPLSVRGVQQRQLPVPVRHAPLGGVGGLRRGAEAAVGQQRHQRLQRVGVGRGRSSLEEGGSV